MRMRPRFYQPVELLHGRMTSLRCSITWIARSLSNERSAKDKATCPDRRDIAALAGLTSMPMAPSYLRMPQPTSSVLCSGSNLKRNKREIACQPAQKSGQRLLTRTAAETDGVYLSLSKTARATYAGETPFIVAISYSCCSATLAWTIFAPAPLQTSRTGKRRSHSHPEVGLVRDAEALGVCRSRRWA